jgi:hypothetical protein
MSGGLEFETQDNAITVPDRIEAACSPRRQKAAGASAAGVHRGSAPTQSVVETIVEHLSGHLHIRIEGSCIGTPGTLP